MSHIWSPLAFVISFGIVSTSVLAFAIAVAFTLNPISVVLHSAFPDSFSFSLNFPVYKRTFIGWSIFHQENSLAVLASLVPFALILKVSISVGVGALSLSQFCSWINVALISSLMILKNCVNSLSLMSFFVRLFVRFNDDVFCDGLHYLYLNFSHP